MDGRKFDSLTRRFGATASRRTALKGLLGGAVAVATGAAVATGDADAIGHSRTCNPGYGRCAHHADCCSGVCETQIVRKGRQRVRVGRCTVSCGAVDATCGSDTECCSGVCYAGLCVPACKETYIGGSFFVGCDSNVDCCSGVCTYIQQFQFSICQEPLGHACEENFQCQSGNCFNGACSQDA